VEREQDGVRLVCCERCAEEDDEDEDGGDRERDGEDEREEGGLFKPSVIARARTCSIPETYHSSGSEVLGRLRLLLPLLLGRRRCLASRRKTKEAVDQLDDYHQRRKPHQRPNWVMHEAIEAQDEARQQDGSVHIGRQERVIIVEDLDRFGGWQHNRRRLRSRNWLDARCRAHVGCVAM